MTVNEFVKKYGVKTFGLVIARYIGTAPKFAGDVQLANELGRMVADLESALQSTIDEEERA